MTVIIQSTKDFGNIDCRKEDNRHLSIRSESTIPPTISNLNSVMALQRTDNGKFMFVNDVMIFIPKERLRQVMALRHRLEQLHVGPRTPSDTGYRITWTIDNDTFCFEETDADEVGVIMAEVFQAVEGRVVKMPMVASK